MNKESLISEAQSLIKEIEDTTNNICKNHIGWSYLDVVKEKAQAYLDCWVGELNRLEKVRSYTDCNLCVINRNNDKERISQLKKALKILEDGGIGK